MPARTGVSNKRKVYAGQLPGRGGQDAKAFAAAERRAKSRQGVGGNPGIGGNAQAGLGQQLSNRVSSGAITQKVAERTAQERQLLEQAFGKDWRTQVFGQGGAKGITGPFALNVIRQKRADALARARKKIGN